MNNLGRDFIPTHLSLPMTKTLSPSCVLFLYIFTSAW
jgi:hypothetical protein